MQGEYGDRATAWSIEPEAVATDASRKARHSPEDLLYTIVTYGHDDKCVHPRLRVLASAFSFLILDPEGAASHLGVTLTCDLS